MQSEPPKADPPKRKRRCFQIILSFDGRDPKRLWTWLLSVFVASAAIGQERPFEREFAEKQGQHAATFEKASALSIDGDIDEAEKLLVGLTEADRSAAMCLLVGDALYNTDPKVSYKLHKKAYDAMPDERTTVLEWAMERHRKQECAEAVPLYKKYLKMVPDDRRLNALLADCLIREGKPQEAVAAWEAASYPRNHTAMDFAICEINGDLSPPKRRGDLLKQIRHGNLDLIEPLFALDLDFDRDWWNGGVDQQALDRDLPFVERLLGKDSKRVQAIRCWLSIATAMTPQADVVTAQLKQFGLIVDGGELPKNSLVAGRLHPNPSPRAAGPRNSGGPSSTSARFLANPSVSKNDRPCIRRSPKNPGLLSATVRRWARGIAVLGSLGNPVLPWISEWLTASHAG